MAWDASIIKPIRATTPYSGGFYLHDLSTGFGHWVVSVYKNGVRVDGADQYYPPHGYIPDARPGDIIHIDAEFVYYDEGQTKVSHNVPNEYTVPK